MTQTRPRILVVDDDPDLLLLLHSSLELDGFECVEVADGASAIEQIAGERFDAVLLDLMMPGVDGWAVLRSASRRAEAPPFVVVSAKSGQEDRARAYRLGAAAYLTKPFDPAELTSTLRSAIEAKPRRANAS